MTPDTQTQRELSLGEKRVRIDFNVTSNSLVNKIKGDTASLINMVDGLKDLDPRLSSLAITAFEEAAMWAVKLATTPKQPEVTEAL
jgi:hypothetical protein